MYTAFYGLREKPFALSPDPKFLFLAESHREALAHLLYGIEQGEGFIAITGEVGTGKTTLCRTLLQRLGADTEVAFLFNPKLSPLELLQAIHDELGLSGAGDSWRALGEELNRFLLDKKREGRRVLLIVDEAQNLELETLEQIRLLSNLETETSKLIQIVMLGQPELDEKLERPELRQLRQRITVRWRLAPLSAPETAEYVQHRLRIASGAERSIFSAPALRELWRRTGGVPRLVNVLCDRALLASYAAGVYEVGPERVRGAAREMDGGGARGGAPASHRSRLPRGVLAGGVAGASIAALALFSVRLLDRPSQITPPPEPDSSVVGPSVATAPEAGPSGVIDAPAIPEPAPVSSPPPGPAPEPAAAAAPPGAAEAVDVVSAPDAPPAPTLASVADAGPPEASTALAVDALLAAWGEEPLGQGEIALPAVLDRLGERGFSLLPMHDVGLDGLRPLEYPTLLRLDGAGTPARLVLALDLDESRATLAGVGGELTVDRAELEPRFSGEAWIVWRDFEALSDTLRAGTQGREVVWLQEALAELGFLARPSTGRFDVQTLAAVLAFQQRHALEADGTVGPRTKMALYAALPRYPVPRLARTAAMLEGPAG
jgi:general secretion pathway protein A